MFGIASIVAFAIAFALYAVHSANPAPWDPRGFALLGLTLLAVHVTARSGPPWHRP